MRGACCAYMWQRQRVLACVAVGELRLVLWEPQLCCAEQAAKACSVVVLVKCQAHFSGDLRKSLCAKTTLAFPGWPVLRQLRRWLTESCLLFLLGVRSSWECVCPGLNTMGWYLLLSDARDTLGADQLCHNCKCARLKQD